MLWLTALPRRGVRPATNGPDLSPSRRSLSVDVCPEYQLPGLLWRGLWGEQSLCDLSAVRRVLFEKQRMLRGLSLHGGSLPPSLADVPSPHSSVMDPHGGPKCHVPKEIRHFTDSYSQSHPACWA